MQGPGQSLRQVREAHGRTIEEMAEATGIRLPFLTALEQEAFDSLPGRGFGKLYIRAYAEVLGFDPRPVIEAYDRAVRGPEAAAPTSEPVAPRPVNAVLARLREEWIAERAEADPSGKPEENEPEPELTEEASRTVLPVGTVTPSQPARSWLWLVPALCPLVLLPLMAHFVFLRSTPHPLPVQMAIAPRPS